MTMSRAENAQLYVNALRALMRLVEVKVDNQHDLSKLRSLRPLLRMADADELLVQSMPLLISEANNILAHNEAYFLEAEYDGDDELTATIVEIFKETFGMFNAAEKAVCWKHTVATLACALRCELLLREEEAAREAAAKAAREEEAQRQRWASEQ